MKNYFDILKVIVMLCMVTLCRSGAMAYIVVFAGLCTVSYLAERRRKKRGRVRSAAGRAVICRRWRRI
ncbi:MAG: hypothetical protein J6N52_06005 [Clostridia bacterium]|nr:hypothetical protein [Clostridia bacterium]